MTFFLVTLAEAYGKAKQPKEGMVFLDEAEALVTRNSEHFYEAELYRIKAELRLALVQQQRAEAEAEIERAIAIAGQQQAKSLQLRAAMSLFRFHDGEIRSRGRQLLYDVLRSFSEGFDTADLMIATTALAAQDRAKTSSD